MAPESAFAVQSDERLVVIAGIFHVLAVPDAHQVVTPDRRCHAPHLGASLTLALRLNRTHPVFRQAADVRTAEDLLSALDADERGPWVLSPAQLGVLTRAMDLRDALLPSASRQHPGLDAEIRSAHARSRRTRAARHDSIPRPGPLPFACAGHP
ncbi:hypothetical protein BIV25_25940 [Streptomyces sp. MUSC 14]|uniref:hypothetical protein n=1 Tax=Streptomyces sp. MUSC 14 TaxID=1354889 RepID=UPI0008F5CBB5|nr:hypothetical protein [Streptomyces sp. MUSC 14]OIJ93226.1 hypothetical protein BIV25_25940 [Streptomyces sp. MUSC 14]